MVSPKEEEKSHDETREHAEGEDANDEVRFSDATDSQPYRRRQETDWPTRRRFQP